MRLKQIAWSDRPNGKRLNHNCRKIKATTQNYCETSRKKSSAPVIVKVSCSSRFAQLSNGKLVNAVQELKSGLPSKTIFVESTIHERLRLVGEAAAFSRGEGRVYNVQIPFVPVTNNFFPSAEHATHSHTVAGRLFKVQMAPQLVDV